MSAEFHAQVEAHLFARAGEHFAFLLCDATSSLGSPVFLARAVVLIPDHEITSSENGWELSDPMLDEVINAAVTSHRALVECHNHGGLFPRFSPTDRAGIGALATFMLEALKGRPYGATVWGAGPVYGEVTYSVAGKPIAEQLSSITVQGDHLRQLASADDDLQPLDPMFDRQLAWFGEASQRQLGRLRVGVVGCGGTGSHVCLQLAHLGIRSFVLVEPDFIEATNLNRTVTTTPAMIGMGKVWAAAQRVRAVAPRATVVAIDSDLRSRQAFDALRGVDILVGCVDNDGARLVLNRLALAYDIPYLDVATDIVPTEPPSAGIEMLGGRIAAVMPDGPCLNCMGELDRSEVGYFLASPAEQAAARRHGYAAGMVGNSPSVVSLNGVAASLLVTELAVLVSGTRKVQTFVDIDLLGVGRPIPGDWITPRREARDGECFECHARAAGDAAELDELLPRNGRGDPLTAHLADSTWGPSTPHRTRPGRPPLTIR